MVVADKKIVDKIAPGYYDLEIQGGSDKGIFKTNLTIGPNETQIINASIPDRNTLASLQATSNPMNARVYLNDRLLGNTPLPAVEMPGREYELRIEKDGYQTYSEKIFLNFNQSYHFAINLSPAERKSN